MEHHKPDFVKINANKKVPVLVDGDFTLFESHSILRYICESRNLPQHWYPFKDFKKKDLDGLLLGLAPLKHQSWRRLVFFQTVFLQKHDWDGSSKRLGKRGSHYPSQELCSDWENLAAWQISFWSRAKHRWSQSCMWAHLIGTIKIWFRQVS